MSLINDALKRANEARPNAASTADGPTLRPHVAARGSSAGIGWLLPALIGVIFTVAALLLWQWFHSSGPIPVHARTSIENVQPEPKSEPVVTTAPQVPPASPLVQKSAETNSVVVAALVAPASQPTNAVSTTKVTVPAPPPVPTYKLQSLFYRVKSPSAVINGKTVFIGDHVSGARVVGIDQESATIITPKGETKVLDLP